MDIVGQMDFPIAAAERESEYFHRVDRIVKPKTPGDVPM